MRPNQDHDNTVPKSSTLELMRLWWRAHKQCWGKTRLEVAILRRYLQQGDVVVDAGANKGAFTFWMQRFVGESGRVVAFEPQVGFATDLARHSCALGWTNTQVEATALSDSHGLGYLSDEGLGGPSARLAEEGTPVPITTLDQWFNENALPLPTLIKIDCEGHEFNILRGAEKILMRARPVLIAELELRHMGIHQFQQTITFLQEFGYSGSFINQGRLFPVKEFNASRHQRAVKAAYWNEPDYCNNFVFTPTKAVSEARRFPARISGDRPTNTR